MIAEHLIPGAGQIRFWYGTCNKPSDNGHQPVLPLDVTQLSAGSKWK